MVARATSKDPDARYARASELAAAVHQAIAEQKAKLTPGALQPTRAPGVPPPSPSAGRNEVFIAEPTFAPGATAGAAEGGTIAPPPQPPSGAGQTVPPEPADSGGGSGVAAPPSAGPAPPGPPRRNPRVALVLGAVAVAVVAAVAFLVLSGGGDDEEQPSSIAATPVAATKLPADLDWKPIRDAPFRRQYAGATAVDGKIWVIGGIGVRTSSTTTKTYDPGTDTWTTGPGLPLPLHHFSAVTYRGEPVVIGGFVPGAELTSKQSDRVYALRGDAWEQLPPLNHPRAAAAAAVVGDKIVVVGGQANGKLVPQTEVFDGDSWQDVADIPTPREHLGAASDGRYLYAVGGRELAADKNLPTLERYDPGSDSWTKLKDMPEATGSVGAAYAGGRVVTVGGESTTSASDAVLGYDIQKQAWSKLPNLPSPRHGVAVTSLKNVIYAIGGATAAGHVDSTSDAEVLDVSGGKAAPSALNVKWRAIRSAPFRTQYGGATAVAGRIWMFGGIAANEKGTDETAVFDRALNIWTEGPKLPRPLNHFSAVTYRGEPVVIGGFVPGAELTSKQSDRVYALRGDAWEQLPPLNHPRAAAAAAVVGDKIVVVGGQANGKLVPQTEVFDGDSWQDVADIPTPREHLGAASDGRYLYAVGGRELAADKNLPTLERYDPGSDSWTKLKDMPEATGSVGAAYAGGRVVTVGGESTTSASDAVLGYDIQKQAWSKLPDLPSPRHGVAVTSLKNVIYAIGGATAAGHVRSTAAAEVLDLG